MKNIILLFLFLIPVFLFAQYPATGNKSRLGYQTTGDGLIWRGVAADTSIKPRTTANAYFQLDTVAGVLRRYIATRGKWQVVAGGGGTNIDSLIYATRYWVDANFFPLEGGTLTGTGGAGFIGLPSQVTAPGTPASGLNIFAQGSSFNWKGTDGFERQITSSLTGGRNYALPDINGTFALGTGTADLSARWTGTNTLGAGSWSDNLTRLQAQVPVQFQSVTTAGLPTGVDLYVLENSTTGFLTRYKSGNWDNIITSTGASSGQVSYFTSAGQIAGSNNHFWDNSNKQLSIISDNAINASRGLLSRQTNNGVQASLMNFEKIRGSSAVQQGDIIGIFGFRGYSGTQYLTDNSLFGGLITGSVSSASVPTSLFFNTSSNSSNYNTEMLIHHNGNVGIGDFGSILSTITAPTYRLQVRGGDLQVDGENNNAERFIYLNNQNNGTSVRNGLVAWVGGSSGGSTERLFTMQAYAPAYTGAAFGGSFVAGNFVISGLNFNVGSATNQRLHFALGSTSVGTTDTIENVFHRFSAATATTLSNSTRFAAISNRGIQFPSTTTSGRVLSKVGQYWMSYNTDSTAFNYRDNSGWHLFATRAYARSMKDGNGIYGGSGTVPASTTVNVNNGITFQGNNTFPMFMFDLGGFNMTSNGNIQFISSTGTFNITSTLNSLSGTAQLNSYGLGNKEAADLSKTQSNYIAGFATDGTVLDLERKRDTTIFLTADTDYDFSAAVTTAQIASRYNRIIIHMTLASGVGADKTTTLHTPDANLMQCEILIRGTDNAGSFDNEIAFGTNNAISSDGTNTSGYTLAQGQGLHVRVVYNGIAYKYIYY